MNMDAGDIPVNELGNDISRDPHATSELLRLTNNSQLGLGNDVRRAADAVTLLGPKQAIARIFSAALIAQSTNMTAVPAELRNWYQRRCVLVASTAALFAERLERISPDLAFTLGMLKDIGIMVMYLQAGSRYSALIHRCRTLGPADLQQMELEDYTFTHADVSAALLRQWALPETIMAPLLPCPIDADVNPQGSVAAFRRVLAVGEAVASVYDMKHSSRVRRMNEALSYYGPSKADICRSAVQDAAIRSTDACRMFGLRAPSADSIAAQIAAVAGVFEGQ